MKKLSKNTSTLLFILLTGVLVVIAFISYNQVRQFNNSVDRVMHTQVVKHNIIELRTIVKDAESGQRGYLITNDSVFLQPVIGAELRSNLVFSTLDSLISYNAGQQENLNKLKTLLAERYLLLNKALKSFENNQSTNSPTDSLLLESKNKMDEVRKQIALLLQTEDIFLERRIQAKNRSATITPIFLLLLSLCSIFAFTLFFFRLQKETRSRVSTERLVEAEAKARKIIEASEATQVKIATHLQLATDSANVGTWSFNVQTQELEWSAVHKKMWGYDEHRTDLTYEDWYKLILPGDKEKVFEKVEEARVNQTGYDVEYRISSAEDETVRYMRSVGKYYYNDKGEAETLTGISIDITEKKQIEETLRYRKALLEAHNEANRDGLLLVDAKGKIISYNQSFIDVWRMPKEIVDAEDDELALAFAMSQLVNPQQFIDKVKWLYEHPSETSIDELEYLDGRIIERHGYSVFGEDGTYYAWSWTFRDITEQKAAAEALRESEERVSKERMVLYNSFMNAPAAIAIVKGDTFIYEFANSEYERILGRKITIGKTVQELFPELEAQGIMAMLTNVFTTGEPFIANEFPVELMNNSTGELVLGYYNTVVQPMKDERGNTKRLLSHGVEVTQNVEARKQIEASEQGLKRYKHMADNANEPFILMREDGTFAYLNDLALQRWGYTKEEALHIRVPDVDPIYNDEVFNAAFAEAQKNTLPQFETLHKKKDGTIYPVEINMGGLTLEGKPYMFAIARDITERKMMQDQLKESEVKFRVLSETVPHMIWTATADGKRNFFNQYTLDYTGLTHEELEGDGWQRTIFQDDLENEVIIWQHTVATGENLTAEKRIRRHDGSFRWHLCHSIARKDSNGNIIGWIGTCTDITEQKAFTEVLEEKVKERTYQLHLQNETFKIAEKIAKFGSYKWNMKTDSLEYSDNLFRLFDCKPNQFIPSYEKFLSFIHPDDLQRVIKNVEETRKTGKLVETPYRIISKTGKIKYLRSSVSFTGGDDNSLLIGTVQDISKDVEAATELRTKNIELENSNAELASFSFVASHDLKEPLRKIRTFSNLIIEKENFSEKTLDYFNRITSSVERMQDLIDSLLNFSRVNGSEMVFEPCDLNALIEVSKDDLQLKIIEKQVTIEYENLPVVMGVCIQLSQLITNLLENAIKYSRPEVKPLIRISSSIIEGEKIKHPSANKKTKYHSIEFADNGIGFEQEYEKKIFGLFQRLHGKDEYSGTGIGLGIVKKIVTYHDGFIVAEGKPNIGATFKIYIPKA